MRKVGAEPIGPANTVEQAEKLMISSRVDAAILDLNLRGRMAFDFVERLAATDLPCLVVSGCGEDAMPVLANPVRYIKKPVGPAKVIKALETSWQRQASRSVSNFVRAQHHVTLSAIPDQGRLKLGEKLLGLVGRVPAALEPSNQSLLTSDVPLTLGDMVIHHSKVGPTEGHSFWPCLALASGGKSEQGTVMILDDEDRSVG